MSFQLFFSLSFWIPGESGIPEINLIWSLRWNNLINPFMAKVPISYFWK